MYLILKGYNDLVTNPKDVAASQGAELGVWRFVVVN